MIKAILFWADSRSDIYTATLFAKAVRLGCSLATTKSV